MEKAWSGVILSLGNKELAIAGDSCPTYIPSMETWWNTSRRLTRSSGFRLYKSVIEEVKVLSAESWQFKSKRPCTESWQFKSKKPCTKSWQSKPSRSGTGNWGFRPNKRGTYSWDSNPTDRVQRLSEQWPGDRRGLEDLGSTIDGGRSWSLTN